MQDFEWFLQNDGYENKEVLTFWLKIINIIFFWLSDLLDILIFWNIFYQI